MNESASEFLDAIMPSGIPIIREMLTDTIINASVSIDPSHRVLVPPGSLPIRPTSTRATIANSAMIRPEIFQAVSPTPRMMTGQGIHRRKSSMVTRTLITTFLMPSKNHDALTVSQKIHSSTFEPIGFPHAAGNPMLGSQTSRQTMRHARIAAALPTYHRRPANLSGIVAIATFPASGSDGPAASVKADVALFNPAIACSPVRCQH